MSPLCTGVLIYYERSSILTMEFPCQVAMAAAGHNEGGGCVLVEKAEAQRDEDDDGDDNGRPPKQPRYLETVDVADDNETEEEEELRWRCLHDQRLSHDR